MSGLSWFKHGWKLKVISLALAAGLWYYAVNEESVEIVRMIPLQVKMESKDMSVLKVSSEHLRVVMKVPRAMVGEVANANIHFIHVLDKEMKQAGEYAFHADPQEIIFPNVPLHVIRIEPQVIQVVVDELVTQKMPVKPNFQGEPAFGYKVRDEELQMDPNAVMVRGPKGQIEKMTEVLTRPISLTGRTRSFRVSTDFQLPVNVVAESAASGDLFIPIHEVSEEKVLKNIVVKMVRPSGALGLAELNPQKITVTLVGPRRVLQNLSPEKMRAYADLSELDYGEHAVDVSWVFPVGVTLKDDEKIQVNAVILRQK